MPDYKYTKDGKKVVVLSQINSTQHVVKEMHVDANGNEFPDGESFVVDQLADQPQETWKERRLRELEDKYNSNVANWQKKIDQLNHALNEKQAKLRARIDALKLTEESIRPAIIQIEAFLAGDYDFFFINNHANPRIVTWGDDSLFDIDRFIRTKASVKLVSLFGDSGGDLTWRINHYPDGSGAWVEVLPATDYTKALQIAQTEFEKHCNSILPDGNINMLHLDEWKKINGLKVPADVERQVLDRRVKQSQQRIDKLNAELADEKEKIDTLKDSGCELESE